MMMMMMMMMILFSGVCTYNCVLFIKIDMLPIRSDGRFEAAFVKCIRILSLTTNMPVSFVHMGMQFVRRFCLCKCTNDRAYTVRVTSSWGDVF